MGFFLLFATLTYTTNRPGYGISNNYKSKNIYLTSVVDELQTAPRRNEQTNCLLEKNKKRWIAENNQINKLQDSIWYVKEYRSLST